MRVNFNSRWCCYDNYVIVSVNECAKVDVFKEGYFTTKLRLLWRVREVKKIDLTMKKTVVIILLHR